jgi:predicted MPP superfamily phosphohydrolase
MNVPLPRIPLPYPLWRLLVLRGGEPPIRVVRSRFVLSGLPVGMNGLRAVFLADLHLGPHVPERYLLAVIEQAVALEPDLFLLGGDYIDRTRDEVRRAAGLLRVLVGTGRPVLGVLGNHDWWAERGVARPERGRFIRDELNGAGVTLIDNRHVLIGGDRAVARTAGDSPGLCIAGLGDCREDVSDPDAAFAGAPTGVPRVVIAHSPDSVRHPFFQSGGHGVSLMLCGHTHGGQCVFPLLGAPILLVKSRAHGRGVSNGPGFPILTSNGVGVSSLPIRLGCPPEMHDITFVSDEGAAG